MPTTLSSFLTSNFSGAQGISGQYVGQGVQGVQGLLGLHLKHFKFLVVLIFLGMLV